MKIININYKSILSLFFIFSFLSIVSKCQLSSSNQNIILKDFNGINKYSSYGSYELNFNECILKNQYLIGNLTSTVTISNVNSLYVQVLSRVNILYFSGAFPSTNTNYTVQFTISDQLNSTYSTDFTLNYYCEDINDSLLEVELFNKTSRSFDSSTYYRYLRIKNLKYQVYNLNIQFNNTKYYITATLMGTQIYQIAMRYQDPSISFYPSFSFEVWFSNYLFNFTFDEENIRNSVYQSVEYQTYPTTEQSEFTQYGHNFYPLIVYSSNVTDNNYIPMFRNFFYINIYRVGQINIGGLTIYKYLSIFFNAQESPFYLQYVNGSSNQLINTGTFKLNYFKGYSIPNGSFTQVDNLVSLEFNSSGLYTYRNSPFYSYYYGYNLITEFPFGFVYGNNNQFNYKASFYGKLSGLSNSYLYSGEYPQTTPSIPYQNPIQENTTDKTPPVISYYEFVPISGFLYSFRIRAKDESTITSISFFTGTYSSQNIGHESLLSYDSDGWLFEKPIKLVYHKLILKDSYGINQEYSPGSIIYNDLANNTIYIIPNEMLFDLELDIQNVTFLRNDIDILNKPSYNAIYFNSTTIPIDYPLSFVLADDVTINLKKSLKNAYAPGIAPGIDGYIPIQYDNNKKLFYCNFIVPKNTNAVSIPYYIHSYSRVINDDALFSPLRVSNTEFDNEGPIITNIINANTFGKVGWRITITDQTNGFSKGYIKAVGSLDSSIFKFNFTTSNSNPGSSIWEGEYDIILNISSKCASQNYTIEYLYLEDTNNLFSYFTKFDLYYDSIKNPLRNQLRNLESYLKTESTCLATYQDSTPPELIYFTSNKQSIDVGQIDRNLSFKFMARDLESGLMETQKPIIYLQEGATLNQIQCESRILSINNTHAEYYCELELPIGFGNENLGGILISTYGFINNAGLYSGFSSDIISRFTNISITYTFGNLLTGYEPYYYESNLKLILFGKWLQQTKSISITYSDGTTKLYSPNKIIGQSVLIIERNDHPIIGPFNVTATMNSNTTTNTITVHPIYYNTTQEPDTPTPTNEPQQCLGNPVCGGPSNGYCNQNSGCVCYSPWIGNDCLSKVIIIPQPNINDTAPTVEIPIDDGSEVFYNSLVSIVSLRELSIDNKLINEHKFEGWILTQIDSLTSQYYTNITFKSKSNQNQTFEIYSTLKWFNNETTIVFANQQLKMNPSSMKYTIDILDYPFESRLNRLQLVMYASFLSNKTNSICPSKEFGDTTTGDNSNYINVQINNKSLYGRFIKRGIIDGNIISLSNDILDNEMNIINNPNQVQTYIGISIPWFERHSTIDPDFSVIIGGSSSSSCSSNNSKLSNTKIAGIVIGCVGFSIVVIVSTIYVIYKRKQEDNFLKSTGNKLKKLNQDH